MIVHSMYPKANSVLIEHEGNPPPPQEKSNVHLSQESMEYPAMLQR